MNEESLKELAAAFERWRKNKRMSREPVPKALWEQAIRATSEHGTQAVARATEVQHSRIVERINKASNCSGVVPAYSRISIEAPSVPQSATATRCPIAEVETAGGLKLRVFEQTQEILNLLSSLCSTGGVR